MSLAGKTALITGAGSGIGRATCKILAREGANIIASDINEKSARETIGLIEKNGLKNTSVRLDVSDEFNVKSALEEILKEYKKPPSIIVNNAGINRDGFILKMSLKKFQNVLDTDLKGTFLITQTFAKAMVENGVSPGSIINVGSISAKHGNKGQVNYCAAKAAIEVLTKTAAQEFGAANFGIRVNVVHPGFIRTPMTAAIPEKLQQIFIEQIPLKRTADPEEVAEVIAFLASEKSSYVTGASIDVNGGLH